MQGVQIMIAFSLFVGYNMKYIVEREIIMDENRENRQTNPRRRPRSKMQIFKEAYLPVIIAGAAALMLFITLIGGIVRAVQNAKYKSQQEAQAALAAQQAQEQLDNEAASLMAKADALAKQYDYTSAVSTLQAFSGDIAAYPELSQRITAYTEAQSSLILWDDPTKVTSLSFQLLIADQVRAFSNETYGTSYNKNYVTCGEFSKILQQLYENGYILVSLSDITDENGNLEIYLPNGKKPLLLTQTNVNYNTYMIDSDGDKLPDAGGAGFASKLVLDDSGKIACEMVDSTGTTVTGAYDLIPILEDFIAAHPDFSYQGARAVIAVTGYNGLFGYRTDPNSLDYFGKAYHDEQVAGATKITNALKELGYELACYTYENEPYGDYTVQQITDEMDKWAVEVEPILGKTDIFVFSRTSDIAQNNTAYSGEKFAALRSAGFTYYLGFCLEGERYYSAYTDHIRMGRVLVTGYNMAYNQQWFEGIFDAASVLDRARGTVPG